MPVKLTSFTILKNGQDARSTKDEFFVEQAGKPVHKRIIENGATSQLNVPGCYLENRTYLKKPGFCVSPVYAKTLHNRPLAKIAGTGKMPIPQKVFSLVGWASCPSENLLKRTFARSLIYKLLHESRISWCGDSVGAGIHTLG